MRVARQGPIDIPGTRSERESGGRDEAAFLPGRESRQRVPRNSAALAHRRFPQSSDRRTRLPQGMTQRVATGSRLLPGGRFEAGSSLSFLASRIGGRELPVRRLGRGDWGEKDIRSVASGQDRPARVAAGNPPTIGRGRRSSGPLLQSLLTGTCESARQEFEALPGTSAISVSRATVVKMPEPDRWHRT